jgi:thiamine biosynthesis protein ThiC
MKNGESLIIIGSSEDFPELQNEIEKTEIALKYKTDTIMDLSTGGDIKKIRQKILEKARIPLGTVPVYQVGIQAIEQRGAIVEMTEEDIFSVIEQQAQEGVDFMTVHAGLTSKAIDRLKKQGRVADIVKGVKGAAEKDFAISEARRKLNWDAQKKLAIDPYKFEEVRSQRKTKTKACSMCGDFCALQMVEDFLNSSEKASDDSS